MIKRNGKLITHRIRSKCDKNLQRQTLEELKLNTPEIFKEKHFLSEGTFGKVYRAKIGDKLFALKKIKVDDAKHERGFPITSIREIKVLKLLKGHPNIVQLTEIVRSKS